MAGVIAGTRQTGIRRTTQRTTVPDNPRAQLMYYLSCVSTVLQLDDAGIGRLTNYSNYRNLSRDEVKLLVELCKLFSPDLLLNKIFFLVDDCGNLTNQFYEISQVSHMFAVTSQIAIGGRTRKVTKVMTCERRWLASSYYGPMEEIQKSACSIM